MSQVVLFDNFDLRIKLRPLSFTRSIADFRIGIVTIREKWERKYTNVSVVTEEYLHMEPELNDQETYLFVDSSVCPRDTLINYVNSLTPGQSLSHDGGVIAFCGTLDDYKTSSYLSFKSQDYEEKHLVKIEQLSDIFRLNGSAIIDDFQAIVNTGSHKALSPQDLDEHSIHIGSHLYIAEGAKTSAATFNTETGPIYIDEGAEIMEGAMLRGPLVIGKNAVVKMGAKIYGDTTIGPHCKVGGEIGNSVLFGYSNKGHDGYLGNSVLGEWCNLGADTNTSNLKNNYGSIKTWDYASKQLTDTGLTFHGLIMGDHSKCGINTMFNTGTTVGVCCNIFGDGFPPKFIASFSWGSDGNTVYELSKALDTAKAVFARRNKELLPSDASMLEHVFTITDTYRT